jgi:uncharacterized protein (TIRG00374 family)
MKKALRQLIIAMVLAVALYGGYAVWSGLGKLGESLSHFTAWSFAAACGLAFCNYVIRFLKWEFYLARLGIRGVSKTDSFLTFLSGFVLTVTPGKVGEVFKSLVLSETHGVPIPLTAPIIVAERVTDLIGIITLIVLGSLGFSGGLVWAGVGAALVGLLLAVISSRRLSHGILGMVERLPGPIGRVGPKLREAYASLATLLELKNLIVPAFLSIGAWSLECMSLWVILRGFGERTSVSLAAFFYATSTLAGALVPVPGGLGITESALKEQLQTLGHVSPSTSTAAMLLVRFATLWFAVLVGFVALGVLRRRYPGLLRSPASPALQPGASAERA